MAEKLFLKSISTAGGVLTLTLSSGEQLEFDAMTKRRDLADGLSEHETVVTRGDDRFTVRTLVDADGTIVRVIAGAGVIPDDWHETPQTPEA